MTRIHWIAALSAIAAAAPAAATVQQSLLAPVLAGAPAGGPATLYCLRVEAVTGSRLERVECWTRQEWADMDVDVDQEWPREGVRTFG